MQADSENLVQITRDDAIAIVTLNRPNELNALSRALILEIVNAFTQLAKEEDIRAIVLTGNGRAFSAGIDLKEAGQIGLGPNAEGASDDDDGSHLGLSEALDAYPWPIIGAINGYAITGGLELALMCDVLLASESAKFADTHVRVGVLPGWGLSQKLSRLIGIVRAKEMSFAGNFVDAETAANWGLISRVYADDTLLAAAIEMAKTMTECDPSTLKGYKKLINEGFAMSYGEGLDAEFEQSQEHAKSSSADKIEAARKQVVTRGRKIGT